MKHESTLRRELQRVRRALDGELTPMDRREQYGAMQALAWALGQNAAAPHTLVSPSTAEAATDA